MSFEFLLTQYDVAFSGTSFFVGKKGGKKPSKPHATPQAAPAPSRSGTGWASWPARRCGEDYVSKTQARLLPIRVRFFLLALIITALFGCERELEVPTPEHEPKLVSNCVAVSGTPFQVLVSRSFGMTESFTESELYLTDARVELWKDGAFSELLLFERREDDFEFGYFSQQLAEPGHLYELRISHPTYPPMRQEMFMPKVPEITVLDFQREVRLDSEGDWVQQLRVVLQDAPDTLNTYALRSSYFAFLRDGNGGYAVGSSWNLAGYDMLIFPYLGTSMFSDEDFDGQRVELILEEDLIGTVNFADSMDRYQEPIFTLSWSSYNEPLYRLAAEYGEHVWSQRFVDFDLSVLSLSPLPMYTNAEGGFGIFAGYSTRTDTMEL